VGREGSPAAPTVNNFVAAKKTAATLGWPDAFIYGLSLSGFPAPAGQVC